MRQLIVVLGLVVLIACFTGPRTSRADESANSLLSNGDFESTQDGKATGWGLGRGATLEAEGGNHFLRLKSAEPGEQVLVLRSVPLGPEIKALELSYRVRHQDIRRGKQNWFDGRIILNFKDADGDELKPDPKPPTFKGTSADWQSHSQQFKVPPGAATLQLMFTLFRVESGQLDFDDIRLVSVPVAPIEAAEGAAREKETRRIAALPKPKPQVPVPSPDKLPPELHVNGNRIEAAGRDVWLQGVAVPSLEWSAGGDHVLESIGVAIKNWKANCIRLPIRENFWSGTGPYQNDGGMKYRQLVDDAVNLCAGNGAYIVLDLHDFRAPEEKHAAFWEEVSARYKNHPAVLFELFNEPHDIPWEVWRNGGEVTEKKKQTDAAVENKQKLKHFSSIGMQKLVDTIRANGAKNIIIAGGLDWGYDLSGILNGFALDDHAGNGIVYSSHVYPWKSDWQHKFIDAAAKYPLFLGEV
ncbi:MAG TPA: glycoside hydrolase family 5 protein, partial [Tepidisphaeraceae bacterium]|nr:glycoside hydrolase family 5 protein [Tepidisphaeraceae bacterium]